MNEVGGEVPDAVVLALKITGEILGLLVGAGGVHNRECKDREERQRAGSEGSWRRRVRGPKTAR
jgi:hypothetical protein